MHNGQTDRIGFVSERDPLLPPPEVCDWLLDFFGDPAEWADMDWFYPQRAKTPLGIGVEIGGIETLQILQADQLERQAEQQEVEQL